MAIGEEQLRKIIHNEVLDILVDLDNDGFFGRNPNHDAAWQDDEGKFHYEWYRDGAISNIEEILEKICKKLEIEHKGPWDWIKKLT